MIKLAKTLKTRAGKGGGGPGSDDRGDFSKFSITGKFLADPPYVSPIKNQFKLI